MDNILPVLDMETIQAKANEFANKGAIESIKEYYSGYNSPFRKKIEEELKKIEVGTGIQLPDIIALINKSLSAEIDAIANEVVSQSFVPLVKKFLTHADAEMKFSDVLKEIILISEIKDLEDCEIEITESSYKWLDVVIMVKDKEYKVTLHEDWDTRKDEKKKYQFLSLPRADSDYGKKTMKLYLEDKVALELPFMPDVLKDPFNSFIARLVIGKTKITMDCREFDEDMLPEHECHCD